MAEEKFFKEASQMRDLLLEHGVQADLHPMCDDGDYIGGSGNSFDLSMWGPTIREPLLSSGKGKGFGGHYVQGLDGVTQHIEEIKEYVAFYDADAESKKQTSSSC